MKPYRSGGGTAAMLVVAALILGACAQSSTGSGSNPDSPVTDSPSKGGPTSTPSALRVRPRPGLLDPHPVVFDRVDVVDQSTLDVFFYGGVEECHGLDRIDVKYADDAVTVTVFEGRVPGAGVCIEIAVYKVASVTLEETLNGRKIVDGA